MRQVSEVGSFQQTCPLPGGTRKHGHSLYEYSYTKTVITKKSQKPEGAILTAKEISFLNPNPVGKLTLALHRVRVTGLGLAQR